MKFLLLITAIILFVTGCKKSEHLSINKYEKKPEQIEINKYIDNNPITIGIYKNDIQLVTDYKMNKQSREEVVFSFYYTNKEYLDNNNQKENWSKFFSEYKDIENYKIGFNFSFYVGETKIEKTILNPNIFAFEPYFYIYLYDDINQPENTFYTHLEDDDVNENTIFSSIKIFLMEPFDISSSIKFTVFTYKDMNDFDENNNYRGNSKYTINIDLI